MDSIRDRHPQLNHTAEHQELVVTIHHILYLWETEACCIQIVALHKAMKRSDCFLWSCNIFKGLMELNQDIRRGKTHLADETSGWALPNPETEFPLFPLAQLPLCASGNEDRIFINQGFMQYLKSARKRKGRRKGETEWCMIAEKIKMELQILSRKYNPCTAIVCITSYKGVNPLSFNAIQQKTKPGQAQSIMDGCSTRGLQTLQGTALTYH